MRHLLSTQDVTQSEALAILDTARELAQVADRPVKKLPTLRGRTVVNLFFEDSTRTRISFEAAAKRLSADVINFSAKGSSLSKGESLKDTALTLQAMGADAVVIRHQASGAAHRLANSDWIHGAVINAGDGTHEHPTQALLDAYTMRDHLRDGQGSLEGLNVVIVGMSCTRGSPGPTSGCSTRSGPTSPWWRRPLCCRSASGSGPAGSATTSTRRS